MAAGVIAPTVGGVARSAFRIAIMPGPSLFASLSSASIILASMPFTIAVDVS